MKNNNDIRYSTDKMIDNLRKVYSLATENDIEEGINWYPSALIECQVLAYKHGLPLESIVASTAALSPSYSWHKNIEAVEILLSGEGLTSAYKNNVDKALHILSTGDTSILSGNKVTRFYLNILGNNDLVTCDRWAIRAAYGINQSGKIDSPTNKQYDLISQAYISLAHELNLTPRELQAIIWIVVRRFTTNKQDIF